MAKKFVIDLLVNADGSVKSVNGVKGAITNLQATADKATGGMISKFNNFGKSLLGVTTSTQGASKAMKVFKVALASTGVGAIVVAFGSLVTFLTSTQRGMDKVSKATAALGATFDVIRDRISTVGEAFSLLFSGKPGEAFDKLKESVSGLTEEIVEETKQAYNLKDALLDLRDTEISLIASTAERRKEIAKARLEAEDETKTYTERVQALDRAAQLENEILNEQLEIAKERARITAEQVGLGESLTEDLRAREEAQARVFELEERSLLLQKSLSTRRNALVRQEQAEQQKLLEARKVTSVTEGIDLAQGLTVKTEIAKKDVEITQATEDAKKEITLESFAGIAQLLGESSKFGKGIAIAQAIRDTFAGANKALAQGGIFGIVSAAGIIASGIANVKSITSTKEPKAPNFAPSAGRGGGSTPTPPVSQPPAFNIVGAGAENQLAQTIAGQADKPTKAYVVSQDVTTAQSLERNIVEGASI